MCDSGFCFCEDGIVSCFTTSALYEILLHTFHWNYKRLMQDTEACGQNSSWGIRHEENYSFWKNLNFNFFI